MYEELGNPEVTRQNPMMLLNHLTICSRRKTLTANILSFCGVFFPSGLVFADLLWLMYLPFLAVSVSFIFYRHIACPWRGKKAF